MKTTQVGENTQGWRRIIFKTRKDLQGNIFYNYTDIFLQNKLNVNITA